MAKYSVKKPYTVFVAVIAVIVLGIVSVLNMTPDLLPNLNMPYIVVATPYPGATPEKVELAVTRPMEQAMATLENIVNITSTSSENYSLLVMEFTEDVNMDTVTVDIMQRITQLEDGWDELVRTPTIMKMNPSMLPVMVAAVSMEDMDTRALSAFVDDVLMPELEGTAGVASISASGMLEETIHVVLSQEKIDRVNQDIRLALEREFADKEAELNDTRAELEDTKGDLENAQDKLGDAGDLDLSAMGGGDGASLDGFDTGQLADGRRQMTEAELKIQQGLRQIDQGIAQLDAAAAEIETNLPIMKALSEGYALLVQEKANLEQQVALLGALQGKLAALESMTEADVALLVGAGLLDEATAANILQSGGVYDPALVPTLLPQVTLLAETAQGLLTVNIAALDALDKQLAEMQLTADKLPGMVAQMEAAQAQLPAQRQQLVALRTQLEQGNVTLAQAETEMQIKIDEGVFAGLTGLGKGLQGLGAMQVTSALAQLEQGLAQLDLGLEQLADAKEAALKQADLHNILTMDIVSQLLMAQNFSMPAGSVKDGNTDVMVSVGNEFESVEELTRLLIFDMGMDDVEPIYLTDVADIYMADNSGDIYAKINGTDGVLLTFSKQSTFATAAVSDNIRAKFDALSADYPDLQFIPMMDQGDYIYIVVQSIVDNLLYGALFAIIILFLFLKDIRPTFITLCSIPISVIFALALMYFSGITINIISLSGLAVAVGMLVDNSVVVIENIYRLRSLGVSAARAAVSGASQVAGAIASSTLTNICVFFPIVFTQGITRQLFTDMALTMAYALLASLVVALTLVPAMSSKMLVNAKPKESPFLNRVLGLYERSLKWVLNKKVLVLAACLVLLVASFVLVLARGYTFMPAMDMPQLTVSVDMPENSTPQQTMALTDEVLGRIVDIDGVETTGAMLGSGGGIMGINLSSGGAGSGRASIYVLLDEKSGVSAAQVAKQITDRCSDLPAEVEADASSGMSMELLTGSGVSVNVFGNDMGELQAAARQVAAVLDALPGTGEVDDGIGDTSPELRFVVDKNAAVEQGLTTAQVYAEIASALTTEKTSTTLLYAGAEYEVLIISGDEARLTPDFVKDYVLTFDDRSGEEKQVALADIATLEETETKNSIARDNQRRLITVNAAVAEGHNVSLVTAEAESALAKVDLPSDITLEFTGENESIMEAFSDLILMLLLGVLLVYLVMVAQFQSLKSPFIVMFTIPLAFTGGMLALFFTGLELSVIALIGFVMLVGIIVNNGIVLVEYINQLRAEGKERREAIIEAGVTRMRPILMTSITTILGLLTMAFGVGTGAALMQPIAIVCIGGLTYATLLTLYVVPIIYDVLNRKELVVLTDEDLEPVEEK